MNSDKSSNKDFLLNIIYTTKNTNNDDSSENSINIAHTEYFVLLVRTALADEVISKNERKLLLQIGKKLGFTVAEADHLIKITIKSDYDPPTELDKRFEQIYEIVNMTLADGSFDENERRLASVFASKVGFDDNEIPAMIVLLLEGIRQGKNKAELFKEYQNLSG